MTLSTIELTPKDFDRAANLLAKSFYNNPSHVYIFPDSSTRLKSLQWGLKTNLKLNLNSSVSKSQSFALVESRLPAGKRDIRGMGFWNYPQATSANFFDKLRSGWLIMPLKLDKESYQRLTKVMSEMDKIKEQVLGENKAWYLNNMAVDKNLRSQGVGTKILQQQLQSIVIPSEFPAILMTQKETNVRFYQKLGFKIANISIIGKGDNSFTNWCLIFQSNITLFDN